MVWPRVSDEAVVKWPPELHHLKALFGKLEDLLSKVAHSRG